MCFLVVSGFTSCRSSKELIYIKDVVNNEGFSALPESASQYIIKPGDVLYVSIKSIDPEVNALFNPEEGMGQVTSSQHQKFLTPQGAYIYGYEVNSNGDLNLPILGKVSVAGTPKSEIENVIQEFTNKFLKDAIVKVKLLNYKVTVLGEVRSPGVYYNYNNKITVLDAIALANGNTDYANIKHVLVVRSKQEGRVAMNLDLSSKNIFLAEGFYLQPNDYVFVEPGKNKNFQLNSQALSLVFSSISILVAVLGLAF
ncbi:MAG: polysaccharide biosynthesis/export family protein [Bacteroidales bacterium]|nr:polysaccharide biosynthesis/export family protein [Bacteroidales bacterium]